MVYPGGQSGHPRVHNTQSIWKNGHWVNIIHYFYCKQKADWKVKLFFKLISKLNKMKTSLYVILLTAASVLIQGFDPIYTVLIAFFFLSVAFRLKSGIVFGRFIFAV